MALHPGDGARKVSTLQAELWPWLSKDTCSRGQVVIQGGDPSPVSAGEGLSLAVHGGLESVGTAFSHLDVQHMVQTPAVLLWSLFLHSKGGWRC